MPVVVGGRDDQPTSQALVSRMPLRDPGHRATGAQGIGVEDAAAAGVAWSGHRVRALRRGRVPLGGGPPGSVLVRPWSRAAAPAIAAGPAVASSPGCPVVRDRRSWTWMRLRRPRRVVVAFAGGAWPALTPNCSSRPLRNSGRLGAKAHNLRCLEFAEQVSRGEPVARAASRPRPVKYVSPVPRWSRAFSFSGSSSAELRSLFSRYRGPGCPAETA